uniref:hypothetical protein n=1 Tax=Roseicyclus sp. TaxID=1914329 RepID=UPI003F6B3B91
MTKFQDDRETDLFGHPVRANHGRRGRPELQVTAEDRDAVEAALVRGWSNDRIARTVNISPASLKRHFRAALEKRDEARDKLELAAFARLTREALSGNMSAMKQLREQLARDAMTRREAEMERKQSEAEDRGVGLGKKELAEMQAREAASSGTWSSLLKGF